jgi:very-short-patch-repair endonuclease
MKFQKGHKINIGKKNVLGKHWKLSEETRKNMSEAKKGKIGNNKGMHWEVKDTSKMSEMKKGKPGNNKGMRWKLSKKTKIKMRESAFEYYKEVSGLVYPRIGRNEKQILDKLEKELGHRIIRQFKCGGYHLDGYIPEINLAIEVDEKHHSVESKRENDTKREEFIKEKLGCQFLRIKDYV